MKLLLSALLYSLTSAAADLPRQFDLRSAKGKNFVSAVKNQSGGTCWTHATMAAVESNLMVNQYWTHHGETGEPNLAEYYLDWWNGFNQHKNHDVHPEKNGLTVHEGGDYRVAAAHLSRAGTVRDVDAQSFSTAPKESAATYQHFYTRDIVWFDAGPNLESIDGIKRSLMEYGAMGTALAWATSFYSGNTFYQPPSSNAEPNHAVTIVGWDDDKKTRAPKPGAWLIKNSWGTNWGSGGYFWISYYDKVAGHHDEMGAVAFQNTVPFDYYRVYSHDLHGWRDTRKEAVEAFNAFVVGSDEQVRSISFYTAANDTTFSITLHADFNGTSLGTALAAPLEGGFAQKGFHTVDLPFPVAVAAGSKLYVKVRLSQGGHAFDRTSNVPVLLGAKSRVTVKSKASPGESYYLKNGAWRDLTQDDPSANFCIKALTDKVTGTL